MVQWAVKNMGGAIPKMDAHLLPDNAAAQAWNCDLASGPLDGLPQPELLIPPAEVDDLLDHAAVER